MLLKRKRSDRNAPRQPHLMKGQETNNFRRSRTLTGSKSSNVRAASEGTGKLQSDRLKKQSLKRHQRLLVMSLSGLLVAIAGLYYLLSQYIGSVQVSYAESTVTQPPQKEPYQHAIRDYLNNQPSKRFLFSLSEEELGQAVAVKYPEVKSIAASSRGVAPGNFIITFRQPTASWKIGEKNYFVDAEGETFENNFTTPPTVKVVDNSGATVTAGKAFVSKGFLRFMGRLIALTNQSGLGEVSEASLPPNTTREVDIRLKGRGYNVKTHTDRDPAAEVEDMKRVIGYLDQKKINPSYIDVRVPGRAYYK